MAQRDQSPAEAVGALESILGRAALEAIERPLDEAAGLPNQAYTSPAFYALETARIFARSWVLAGFGHQIPASGDVLPVTVAERPVLLVRGADGTVRAFHNVCRHRGAKLLDQPKQGLKLITCPNHAWSYGLDGRLRSRPHFHGGGRHDVIAADCHRADLVPLRCETWHDWVFVNLDGTAPDLADYLRPMTDRLSGYDFSALGHGFTLDFEVAANWKLAYENFIEPYHVFACHPWLHDFVPMEHRSAPGFEGDCLYCGYEFAAPDPSRGLGLPYFPALPAEKTRRGDWFVLFPSFGVEIFPDQVDLFLVTPLGPERSRERIVLYFVGEGASAAAYAEARQRVAQNWRELNEEDIPIIERMQQGRHSEGFDGGVLSPYWDGATRHFAHLVVEHLK